MRGVPNAVRSCFEEIDTLMASKRTPAEQGAL